MDSTAGLEKPFTGPLSMLAELLDAHRNLLADKIGYELRPVARVLNPPSSSTGQSTFQPGKD